MASCLQLPMASSYSLTSSTTSLTSSKNRVSSIKSRSVINSIRNAVSKLPMPPANPNDPFLKKLASVASTSPETFLQRPQGSDTPPFLDIIGSPTLMATPAQGERSVSYNKHRSKRPPPDLPSILLNGRIVFIGMPLVPAVTELVIAQLMYLQYMDSKEPIYIYINSTGTTRDDGETVGLETEGFAIYDAMMAMKTEIHTLGLGFAVGQACLLLSAGTKGKRFMLPHATATIQQPEVPPAGLMPAIDVAIRAKEAMINRDNLVKLLAKHTGNSEETVAHVMSGRYYMDATKAKAFGVIDRVLWRGQEKMMKQVAPPEDWDKGAGIKEVDGLDAI